MLAVLAVGGTVVVDVVTTVSCVLDRGSNALLAARLQCRSKQLLRPSNARAMLGP